MQIPIHDVNINNVTLQESLDILNSFLSSEKTNLVFTPNSEIIMKAIEEPSLTNSLNSASLVVPDGAGVILASKILGTPLKERVAGFDLTTNFLAQKRTTKLNVFLFGAKEEVIKQAYIKMLDKFPSINIVGYINGYFDKNDESNIIDIINSSKPDILLVALGAPKQEQWLSEKKDALHVPICIGVGGTFDVLAEISTRAPKFFQENSLEWLYRLYKEPWRFFRMLALPKFILYTLFSKIRRK
jgi:N-acetylglucosaminyldiphosphoundecaprenol N-acetyl-beta-D-mannosaminyltransferase